MKTKVSFHHIGLVWLTDEIAVEVHDVPVVTGLLGARIQIHTDIPPGLGHDPCTEVRSPAGATGSRLHSDATERVCVVPTHVERDNAAGAEASRKGMLLGRQGTVL